MRHQLLPRKSHWCGDAQQATRLFGEVAHLGKGAGNLLKRCLGFLHQALPCFRQAHAAGGALHQSHTGNFFKLGNMLTHGSLADVQSLGRCGIAALLGQSRKPVNMTPERFDFFLFHPHIVHKNER